MAKRKKPADPKPIDVVPVIVDGPPMQTGDALHHMAKDMIHLQEAITEKLALIPGTRVVCSRPLTLEVPLKAAEKIGLPVRAVCPEMLSPMARIDHARKLGVNLKEVVKTPKAWKHLYNVGI